MSDRHTAGRLNSIEACRGVAATAVVLYHAARHVDKVHGAPGLRGALQFGHAGVDLFFVISGFIILYVHYRDIDTPGRLPHYLGRRLTRVMPTYWVALAVTIILASSDHAGLPTLPEFVWSATLAPSGRPLILGIAWTLRYELVFYAIFTLLIVNRIIGLAVMAVWLIAIVALALTQTPLTGALGQLTGAFNIEFFLGMAVAYKLRNGSVAMPLAWLMAGITLFICTAGVEDLGLLDGYADYSRLAYGLPSAMIILGAAEAGRQGRLAVAAPLSVLGSASYSIYLFQFVFIGLCWQVWLLSGLDRWTPYTASFPLLAGAGVVGGILMSRWVEHPLIRLTRSASRTRQPLVIAG